MLSVIAGAHKSRCCANSLPAFQRIGNVGDGQEGSTQWDTHKPKCKPHHYNQSKSNQSVLPGKCPGPPMKKDLSDELEKAKGLY